MKLLKRLERLAGPRTCPRCGGTGIVNDSDPRTTTAACFGGRHWNCSGQVFTSWLPRKEKRVPCSCGCHRRPV